RVWVWGDNSKGQLALDPNLAGNQYIDHPVQVTNFYTYDPQNAESNTTPQTALDGGPLTFTAVAAGKDFSLALDVDGHVWAWGNNYDNSGIQNDTHKLNQLGRGADNSYKGYQPMRVLMRVKKIGTLGDEMIDKEYAYSPPGTGDTIYQNYRERDAIVAIAAGEDFGVALSLSGFVYTWGSNSHGQLGLADKKVATSSYAKYVGKGKSPSKTSHMQEAVSLAAGGQSAGVLFANGTLFTYGDNTYGQLGDGSVNAHYSAVRVQGGEGSLWSNTSGGYDASRPGLNPNDENDFDFNKVVAVAMGEGHTAAIALNVKMNSKDVTVKDFTVSPGLYGWGRNDYQQLGDGVTQTPPTQTEDGVEYFASPMRMIAADDAVDGTPGYVYAGARQLAAGYHATLAQVENQTIKGDGSNFDAVQLLAWGDNAKGQLGNYALSRGPVKSGSYVDYDNTVAREVLYGSQVIDDTYHWMQKVSTMSVGGDFIVFARETGTVFASGANDKGQLGDYTPVDSEYPVVVGTLGYETLTVKGYTDTNPALRDLKPQVVLVEDEKLLFDLNNIGYFVDLGFNLLCNKPEEKVDVTGLEFISLDESITAYNAAASSAGEMVFGPQDPANVKYGDTFIQIYQKDTGRTLLLRVKVIPKNSGFNTAPMVAAGKDHVIALKADGSIWAWGSNASGQLGDTTFVDRAYPVEVKDEKGYPFTNGVSVAAGDNFSVVLRDADGDLSTTADREVYVVGGLSSITTNLVRLLSDEEMTQLRRANEPMVMYMGKQGTGGSAVLKPFSFPNDNSGDWVGWNEAGILYRAVEYRDANGKAVTDSRAGRHHTFTISRSNGNTTVSESYLYDEASAQAMRDAGYEVYYLAYYVYYNEVGEDCGIWVDIPENCPNPHDPHTSETMQRERKTVEVNHIAVMDYMPRPTEAVETVKDGRVQSIRYTLGDTTYVYDTVYYDEDSGATFLVTQDFANQEIKSTTYAEVMANEWNTWGWSCAMFLIDGTAPGNVDGRMRVFAKNWKKGTKDYFSGMLSCGTCGLQDYNPADTITPVVCGDPSCTDVGQNFFTMIYEDAENIWAKYPSQRDKVDWHQLPETEHAYRIWRCQSGHVWIIPYDGGEDIPTPEVKRLGQAVLVDNPDFDPSRPEDARLNPRQITTEEPITNIIDVAAGADHMLALTVDGHVYAAGANTEGELGQGSTEAVGYAALVKGYKGKGYLEHVVDVAAGEQFSVALMDNGTVYTWGINDKGQLGNELVPSEDIFRDDGQGGQVLVNPNHTTTPVLVNSGQYGLDSEAQFRVLSGVYAISAGRRHVVAAARENTWNSDTASYDRTSAVFGWGDNNYGQLGNIAGFNWNAYANGGLGGYSMADGTTFTGAATRNMDVHDVTAVSAGGEFTLIRTLRADDAGVKRAYLVGFGRNNMRQLSDACTNDAGELAMYKSTPTDIVPGEWVRVKPEATWLDDTSIISAGNQFGVAMMENGRVVTWGDNSRGQLGLAAIGEEGASEDTRGEPYFAGQHEADMVEFSFAGTNVKAGADSSFGEVTLLWTETDAEAATINTTAAKRYTYGGFNLIRASVETSTIDMNTAYPDGYTFIATDDSVVKVFQRGDGAWVMKSAGYTYSHFQKLGTTSVAAVDSKGNVISVFLVRIQGYKDNDPTKTYVATPMVVGTPYGAIALKANGEIYLWGRFNARGYDSDITGKPSKVTEDYLNPVPVMTVRAVQFNEPTKISLPGNVVATQMAVGAYYDEDAKDYFSHVVVLGSDGDVYMWGDNSYGQTGFYEGVDVYYKTIVYNLTQHVEGQPGAENQPMMKDITRKALQQFTGYYASTASKDQSEFTTLLLNTSFVSLNDHLVQRAANGQWDAYYHDDLGKINTTDGGVFPKNYDRNNDGEIINQIPWLESFSGAASERTRIVSVAAGDRHTLLLDSKGNVWAFGDNANGQLGQGDTNELYYPENDTQHVNAQWTIRDVRTYRNHVLYTPVKVVQGVSASDDAYLSRIVQIDAGSNYSLALRADGVVFAWGGNERGQLGIVATGNVTVPSEVSRGDDQSLSDYYFKNAVELDAGRDHTMAIAVGFKAEAAEDADLAEKITTRAYTWGSNQYGKLGQGKVRAERAADLNVAESGVTDDNYLVYSTNPSLVRERYTASVLVDGTGIHKADDPATPEDESEEWDVEPVYEDRLAWRPLERVRQISASSDYSMVQVADTLTVVERHHQEADKVLSPDEAKDLGVAGTTQWAGSSHPAYMGTEYVDSLVWSFGRNDHGQLGLGEKIGTEQLIVPEDTTYPHKMLKGGTVSKVEIVGGEELTEFVRETLYLGDGYTTYHHVLEDGTVWFSGSNSYHEGADYTTVERNALTQTGTETYYSLVIHEAQVWDTKSSAFTWPTKSGSTWTWPPTYTTTELKMPRSITIYEDQRLYITPDGANGLHEAFSSTFNLIEDAFERQLPEDAVVTYTSSDENIATFVYDTVRGKWYLRPTGVAYGRVIITVNNIHNNYRGDYEVIVLPTESVGDGLPVASVTVKAAENATIALQANGTVWMWGR
ncbi:MAG: hypothetical protein NC311_13480, partial [Muribaculaceae bacterium]|nr:hypothetical protein [Muribaculaceae bacterium]